MTDQPIRVEVLSGSVREGRVGPAVASWFLEQARALPEFDAGLIDLGDYELSDRLSANPPAATGAALAEITPRLGAADAFVVVTPEYNHSFPASLKTAIDWHHAEWQGKPVGLVSYGGVSGGLRAAEHLRQVFAELNATTVRNTVSFHRFSAKDHGPWDDFGDVGDQDAATAARALLDQLGWWALALREARAARPYRA
ncbi:NADPH-dependent FMN reductase [Streptomyces sp. NBRC 109706]|uniref:NADPH-dependent FMN reductase n=1 Tax=Streptomyces sp. NBRC 109706 TaxID=1550035 RepID=UPI0007851EEA|nr:NAD(P)H-dependent oxidoreductase [Streptomyces sp. NBRC 109706]